MVKETIQIYLRFRPPTGKTSVGDSFQTEKYQTLPLQNYAIEESGLEKSQVTFGVNPSTNHQTIACNRKETYRFHFDAIFGVDHGQDQIFDRVSKPVIDQ